MRILRQTAMILLIIIFKFFDNFINLILSKKNIKYIVLLQPGSAKDIEAYIPIWLSKKIRGFIFSGIIYNSNKKYGNGLILSTPLSIKELVKFKKKTCNIKLALLKKQKAIGSKKIAMVGQIPAVFSKHNIEFDNGIIEGTYGTLFSIMETLYSIEIKYHLHDTKITILGLGKTGSALLKLLKDKNYICNGLDLGDIDKIEKQKFLKESNVIINLLPRGKMIRQYINFFNDRVIVIDDTHPMMNPLENFKVFKVVASSNTIKFFPKLPGYPNFTIPGCVVESIVKSEYSIKEYDDFSERAKSMGLFTPLMKIEEFK